MGVHADVIPSIIEMVKQDVVLIDLDNNNVQVPFPIPDLPEPEATTLLNDLTRLLYADISVKSKGMVVMQKKLKIPKELTISVASLPTLRMSLRYQRRASW